MSTGELEILHPDCHKHTYNAEARTSMTAIFLAIIVLSLLLLAYYRIPLLISIAILAGLTFAFTELRHFYLIPG